MRFLVATDSVHTTAAACDYLDARLDPDDTVTVVTVPGSDPRDGEDALNVAEVRLVGGATVETERLEADGEPASAILSVAASEAADVVIVGSHAGVPGAGATLGGTAKKVIESADVPVVVVPLSL
jgi:nucleotide-binding universal stress UspA family protein